MTMARSIQLCILAWSYILSHQSLASAQTNCPANHYNENNVCLPCPEQHTSLGGNRDISGCLKCPGGMVVNGPTTVGCKKSETFDATIDTAKGWRIWAPSSDTSLGWAVNVIEIQFYEEVDCSGPAIDLPGKYIDSGHNKEEWGPENAFQPEGIWVGKQDIFTNFWLGKVFDTDVTVSCMKVNFGTNYMKELRVQALIDDEWKNVMIRKHSTPGVVSIHFRLPPTASPKPSESSSSPPTILECEANEYVLNGTCAACPESHISLAGTKDITGCLKCPEAMETTPGVARCRAAENCDQSIDTARGWRIWAPSSHTRTKWLVGIIGVQFYSDNTCTGPAVDMPGTYIESGRHDAAFGPEKAFDGTTELWGGRPDKFNNFYLGKIFDEDVTVTCMAVAFSKDFMNEVRVQAYIDDKWVNVQIWRNINPNAINKIRWTISPTTSPVPSLMPSLSPTVFDCGANHYITGLKCLACPEKHISLKGAKDISECLKCPDGMEAIPEIPRCRASEDYDQTISTARGWRIWAPAAHTNALTAVRIMGIVLYEDNDCSEPIANITGTYMDSGHNNEVWKPENAFIDNELSWLGRADQYNNFYIGKIFDEDVTVTCMAVGFGSRCMREARVQAYIDDEWVNVQIWNKMKPNMITKIRWDPKPTFSPSPSLMPSLAPTNVSSSYPSLTPTELKCEANFYSSNNTCLSCPERHISQPGSQDISDCLKCPDSMEATPGVPRCKACETFNTYIKNAKGWRIWAPADLTSESDGVDVVSVQFFSEIDCSGSFIYKNGTYIDSGRAGSDSGPENAFEENELEWSGRPDEFNNFYIGKMFEENVTINSVRVNFGSKYMKEVRVQALVDDEWENVWIEHDVAPGVVDITWEEFPSSAPSSSPSLGPSFSPSVSNRPSTAPTSVASNVPTVLVSNSPTLESSVVPSIVLSSTPTLLASNVPTVVASNMPTQGSSVAPTFVKSNKPTLAASNGPTTVLSSSPTDRPTPSPSSKPTPSPSSKPTPSPSSKPTPSPSSKPTPSPSSKPTPSPSSKPTPSPSSKPTPSPSSKPTPSPSSKPTPSPSYLPIPYPAQFNATTSSVLTIENLIDAYNISLRTKPPTNEVAADKAISLPKQMIENAVNIVKNIHFAKWRRGEKKRKQKQ